ncbi:MAG: glycosyltransferase [Bacteroidia bacterium]
MPEKNLHIITSSFPFGKAEQFFEAEVLELSRNFDRIILYPLNLPGEQRVLPANVSVNTVLATSSRRVSKSYYLKNIPIVLSILSGEFFHTKKKKALLADLRDYANSVLQSKLLSEVFIKQAVTPGQNYFYSFWMNDGALLLSLLKRRKSIPDFVFRVNGFDLFDDRTKKGYMPFRYFNFSQAKKVIVLSEVGFNYLAEKKIFPEKLYLSYYGIYDQGLNPFDEKGIFTIVSCSNMIPLKRIDKIVRALQHVSFPVKWFHFGDGVLMSEIKAMAEKLPANIHCELRGSRPNSEVIGLYKEQSINLFMHMSDTEGLGLAIIEAQSFGIPALAVAAGGVVNVVNERTGLLIDHHTTPQETAALITQFAGSEKNAPAYRRKVKEHWDEKFNAKKNYFALFEKITG